MSAVFLAVFAMSISAGILIGAVLLARFLLKKTPKTRTVFLWGLVALRLLLPSLPESPFSVVPNTAYVIEQHTDINTSYETAGHPMVDATPALKAEVSVSRVGIPVRITTYLWLSGILLMLLYYTISTQNVKRRIASAELIRENIYRADVPSPFIFGLRKPRIYLPGGLDDTVIDCILTHERVHIRRFDHLVKPFGFLLLSIHWFNPLCWIGYFLFCRDLEAACDEQSVCSMTPQEKVHYTEALILCSQQRYGSHGYTVSFGENAVQERVKRVLLYQRPSVFMSVSVMAVTVILIGCFMTDPMKQTELRSKTTLPAAEFTEDVPDGYKLSSIEYGSMRVTLPLPIKETIRGKESKIRSNKRRFPGNGLHMALDVYNENDEQMLMLGFSRYSVREESEDNPLLIFSNIALGNNYMFNVRDCFDIVSSDEDGATAITDVIYRECPSNIGIVSYSKRFQSFFVMELDASVFDEETARMIAEHIRITDSSLAWCK